MSKPKPTPTWPFIDFPDPDDWGLADKLFKWRSKHEKEILRSATYCSLLDAMPRPPDQILHANQLTRDGAVWLAQYIEWYSKLTEELKQWIIVQK